MKLFKRGAALVLVLALLAFPGAGAATEADTAARTLNGLGLFQGTIAGRFDEESMALDRTATRAEALVMFLRLIGREGEVKNGQWSHGFSDVDPWAGPYVGYAAEKGLANGVGGDQFGFGQYIGLSEYVTFLLRALGYDDAAGDFDWKNAADIGLAMGLYDRNLSIVYGSCMTRGALARVSLAALSAPRKGGTETLAGSMVRAGALDGAAAEAAGVLLEAAAMELPEMPKEREESEIAAEYVQRVFELVNEERVAEGIDPLILDEQMNVCASIRAVEIMDLFDHSRPDGSLCFSVLDENGMEGYISAGENIAFGQPTPERVVHSWMNSPGHRANILNSSFKRIGIGWVRSHWVQLFATYPDD